MTPSDSSPELTVALPAYEEADNLEVLLPALRNALESLQTSYEIIVVDTESPRDRTPTVCLDHGALYLPRRGGSAYGNAIRTALQASRGRWVILMDADGSHNPSFITKLWDHRDDAELVIASRYTTGGQTENPKLLILMSLVVNVIFRLVLGLRCADVSNSFRLYRGDDIRALSLHCNHFDIVEEILVKLCFSHRTYRIRELPFTFEKRKTGKTKRNLVTFALGYLVTLARLIQLKRQALRTS